MSGVSAVAGDAASLIAALSNFGAFGVLVAFLIWKDLRSAAERKELAQAQIAAEAVENERRLAYDRERLEADKALAGSLAALTSAIQSGGRK